MEPGRTTGLSMVSQPLPSLQCCREVPWRYTETPLHTCILQATFWGYCCIWASTSPTSCSGPWALLSFSTGTSHLRWPGCGSVPTCSKTACSVKLRFPGNLGDQLLEAVMTQASGPLHPSMAQCHVTPQLGFLGCTFPLSAGFNFHFLS